MKSYEQLIDMHHGESAFILGAGTSLFKITKDNRYKNIFDHVTISINSSILATDWEEGDPHRRYWTSNDVCTMLWSYWQKVIDSKCKKVIRNSWDKHFEYLEKQGDEFYQFPPRSGWDGAPQNINDLMNGSGCTEPKTDQELDDSIKEEEKALCAISSIPSAIDLAIQMGCKQIFLLGVDHYMSGSKSHFWDYYSLKDQPRVSLGGYKATHRMQKAMFEENQKTYAAIDRFAEKKGAKIYMCNTKSRVKCFQKIDFSEVFNIVQ